LQNFPDFARSLHEQLPVAEQFARIETFAAMTPTDRLHLEGAHVGHVFEVGLHLPPEGHAADVRAWFADYANDCGFMVNGEFEFEAGRLLFVAVEGNAAGLERLAQFTLTRVVRPMPHLRAARPVTRSMPLAVSFALPSGEPLSREPKVAVLDGGLPAEHVLDRYVRRYFLADEDASDVADFNEHGLGVTSASCLGRSSRKRRRSALMRRSITIGFSTPRSTGKTRTSCIARSAMSKLSCSRASTSSSTSAWDRTCRSRTRMSMPGRPSSTAS